LISATELDSSSVAPATDWTLVDAAVEAAATVETRCAAFSAVELSEPAVVSTFLAADETAFAIEPTVSSNSLASFAIACFFSSRAAIRSAMSRR
jgi:hypothetical protein